MSTHRPHLPLGLAPTLLPPVSDSGSSGPSAWNRTVFVLPWLEAPRLEQEKVGGLRARKDQGLGSLGV